MTVLYDDIGRNYAFNKAHRQHRYGTAIDALNRKM